MKNTLQRIKEFIDYKGISIRLFEQSVGMSNGSFASQLKNNKTIGVDKLENILQIYNEINPEWILTGKGEMILSADNRSSVVRQDDCIKHQDEDLSNIIKQSYLQNERNMERIDMLIRQQNNLIEILNKDRQETQKQMDRILTMLECKLSKK